MSAEYSVEEVRARFEAAMREARYLFTWDDETSDYEEPTMRFAYIGFQAAYAERIKADEGAVAEVYEYPRDHHEPVPTMLTGIRFTGMPLPPGTKLFPHPPAQVAQETPCSLNEALAAIEAWADRGNRLDGDDAPRLRAIADRIAPTAEPVAQGEAACPKCGASNAIDAATQCIPDGDSCPGCDNPLEGIWERQAQPASPEQPAGRQGSNADKARAFEWLRNAATADGAPDEAGIAFDTWHALATAAPVDVPDDRKLVGYVWPNEADYDHIHRCLSGDGDQEIRRIPAGAVGVYAMLAAATSPGEPA